MTDTDSSTPQAKPERSRFRKMLAWAFIVLRVLGAFSAVDAIMSNRTAAGAIAWSLGLVAAPVVALPAYWVFGRSKFEGYLEARRDNQEEFDALAAKVRRWDAYQANAWLGEVDPPVDYGLLLSPLGVGGREERHLLVARHRIVDRRGVREREGVQDAHVEVDARLLTTVQFKFTKLDGANFIQGDGQRF